MGGRGNISLVRTGLKTGDGNRIGQEIQSKSNEYSKIYIATKITPIYSEIANQQQLLKLNGTGSNVCGICGANLSGLGKMSNNNKQGIMNICPLHGCSFIQK